MGLIAVAKGRLAKWLLPEITRGAAEQFGSIFAAGLDQLLGSTRLQEPYRQHPVVYAAVSAVATNISHVPLEFFPKSDKKKERPVEESLPAALLANPGGQDDVYGNQLLEGTVVNLELTGNAFWFLDGLAQRSPTGPRFPTSLKMLDPRRVRPVSERGKLVRWEYRTGYDTFLVPLEKMVHFKYFNPYDETWGLGPLQAAIVEVTGDFKAAQWNERFFDNSALPAGLLTPKVGQILQAEAIEKFRIQWENRHRGAAKHGALGVTTTAFDYLDLGLSQKEMDFLEGRNFSREQILMIFKVPPIAAGILRDANYNVAIEQRAQLWHNNLIPKTEYLSEVINRRLCDAFGIEERCYFKLETVRPLIEDQGKIHEMAYKLWQMGVPFSQINTRLQLGYDTKGHPGLETGFIPFSLVNADEQAQKPVEEPAPGGGPPTAPAAEGEEEEETPPAPEEEKTAADAREIGRTILWKSLIAKIRPHEKVFEKRTRDHWNGLMVEVLRNIHVQNGKVMKADDDPASFNIDAVLWDEEDAQKDIQRKTNAVYKDAVDTGGSSIFEQLNIGVDFNLLNPAVQDFLSKKRLEIAGVTDGPLRDNLRAALQEGMNQGYSVDKIADLVAEVFTVNRSRALRIARTEMAESFNNGRYTGMAEAKIPKIEWLSARDSRVRDSHVRMDGEVVVLGDKFPNGLLYPGDVEGPPEEIVNCRCTPLPAGE